MLTIEARGRSVAAVRARIAAWLALAALVLGACALQVKFVGDYDELLDASVWQVQTDTNTFYASYEGETPPTQESHDEFFAGAIGSVDAMSSRAQVLEQGLERTPLSRNFKRLREQFGDARGLDLTKTPLRVSSRKALDESFKALQTQLVWMKRTQEQAPQGE